MPKTRRDRQVNFYADEDVFSYLAKLPSGSKSVALNNIIRAHLEKERGRRRASELEGLASWLEMLNEEGGNPLAGEVAVLIDSYFDAMHESFIGGLQSAGKPVPIDHRPCKYCGDDE
jgi:hypothetical protein